MKVVIFILALGHLTQFAPTFEGTLKNLLEDAEEGVSVTHWCERNVCEVVMTEASPMNENAATN